MTSNEIARMNAEERTALARYQWQEAEAMARDKTGLLPPAFRDSPGSIILARAYGDALNVPMVTVFAEVYIVKGRPSMSAKMMMALVRRAGHRIRSEINPEGTAARCTIIRTDDPDPFVETFTLGDAVKAGLCQIDRDGNVRSRDKNGEPQPWERYTRTMLRNRAVSAACRAHVPDVILGFGYTPDELDEIDVPDARPIGEWVDADDAPPAPRHAAAAAAGKKPAAPEPATGDPAQAEGQWRTEWFDRLADAVNRRDLTRITDLGKDAASHGHSDLIDAAKGAWRRVQGGGQPAAAAAADDGDQDDTGGASMDDDIVDADIVEDGGPAE